MPTEQRVSFEGRAAILRLRRRNSPPLQWTSLMRQRKLRSPTVLDLRSTVQREVQETSFWHIDSNLEKI